MPTPFYISKDHPILIDAKNKFRFFNEELSHISVIDNNIDDCIFSIIIDNCQTFDFNDFMTRNKLKLVDIKNYYYDSFNDKEYNDVINLTFYFIGA